MRTLLELLYEYRRLLSRRDSDAGLEMAEIDDLSLAESDLATALDLPAPAELGAVVRGGKADDPVRPISIGRATMIVAACPYLEAGSKIEIVVDDEPHGLSYRFKARVTSLDDDDTGDPFRASLELVGAPILLRRRLRTAELVAAAA